MQRVLNLAVGPLGLAQKAVAFAGRKVFPGTVHCVQLHAGL
jgi:hypothetical protein